MAQPGITQEIQTLDRAKDYPTIGAIRISGAEQLPTDIFAEAIESTIGKDAAPSNLEHLAKAVAKAARDRGYIFASATIPAQNIKIGIVSVDFDVGTVAEIRILGSNNKKLHSILSALIGQTPTKAEVEHRLLLAGDVPGITIARTRLLHENGKGVLLVEVTERRISGNSVVDNWGTKNFGPVRARAQLNVTSVIADGDALSVQGLSTIVTPRELAYVSAQYSASVGSSGTQLGVAVAGGNTKAGEQDSAVTVTGKSRYGAAFASTPLQRSRQGSIWLNAEFAYLSVDQEALNALIQQDQTAAFTIRFTGTQKLAEGRVNWGVGITQGLDVLGASKAGELLLSRSDASGIFTKATLWADWLTPLSEKLSLRVQGFAQLASRALLTSQELSYGGPYFGRGYDFSERSGDSGAVALIEVRRALSLPLPSFKWAHVYGFADGGYLTNKNDGFGGGTLFSAGAGVRAGFGKLEFGIEGAFPLKDIRFETGDKAPKLNMMLGYGF